MNKEEIIQRQGKERLREVHYFLDMLNSLYQYPYSEKNLYYFAESLVNFTSEDLKECLKILEDRESTYALKFNEIKNACRDARSLRLKRERLEESKNDESIGVPMPQRVKDMLSEIEKQFTSEDPTQKERNDR